MMADRSVLVDRDGPTLIVTLNRPRVLNALDAAMFRELGDVLGRAGADDEVRVLVLTGAGDKSFAAGADLKELAAETPAGARDLARRGQHVFNRLERLGKPVIAAINGFALGGGCELAMACTIRLAADTAQLGQPEITLGLIPGFGGSQRLPRLVGRARAAELLLTGRSIDAEEACRIGLVTRVVPAADLMATARDLARTVAAGPPLAVRYMLAALVEGADMPLDQAQEYEAGLFGLAAATEDMREGTAAFLEKRKPQFKGR
jgi:enoyl-CoA hydratase